MEERMASFQKKSIFWFEDDPESLQDYISELRKKYELSVGARWENILKPREYPFDLVLLDLMIHHKSSDYKSGEADTNISYAGIHWTQTGVEFLRRIRDGEYEAYGFKKDVLVIVGTAVVNYPAKDITSELGISDFLEKPFTFESLIKSIQKALNLKNGEYR